MTRHLSEDDPLDLATVSADDAMVERLRSLSPDDAVVWGDDDEPDDPSYALLRALQHDVSAELPDGPALPVALMRLGASRRSLSRTATVAAVTAGVLSLAGVAAAATVAPVRSAVADAVSSVVDAVTPRGPAVANPAAAPVSDTPTATIPPPRQLVRDAARSAEAARFIGASLARAGRLTKAGQYAAAANVLDAAERRLPLVTPADGHDALQVLLGLRRAGLAAARVASPPRSTDKPTARPTAKPHATKAPGGTSDARPAQPQPDRRPTAVTTTRVHARSVPVHLPTAQAPAADRATQNR